MEQNQRRTAEQWSGIFSHWRESGQSQRGYCRGEGISFSAFGYWRRKLEQGEENRRIVRVGLAEPITSQRNISARASGVTIYFSGAESEEVLVKVFRALKAVS